MYLLKRMIAFLLDVTLCGVFVAPIMYYSFNTWSVKLVFFLRNPILLSILFCCFIIIYFIFFELLFGITLGKKILNLTLYSENNDKISKKGIVIRNLTRIIDHGLLPIGLFMMVFTKNKRVGDLISKISIMERR
ncbi:Uncharacterized membrane protein YckC, RDD family [Paenibacillus algorifonticola]|uniref:Uncharacterized membrane protein YckC, RDD family n=1 Tax=Paenibacillus algorifonticola TaxID=684063 RepID=A0A1I2IHT9_9BACL|nr:Uncharacterized membrane protein YckC, RDD family [Paenibacillus algorifonticola]